MDNLKTNTFSLQTKINFNTTLFCTIYHNDLNLFRLEIYFNKKENFENQVKTNNDFAILCQSQLQEYFNGKRKIFTIPYIIESSKFGTDILNTLSVIPFSQLISYKDLAAKAGHNGAFRKTGTICRLNPLPIIIPCHRVINSSGKFGDYAYGGAEFKNQLITMEKTINELGRQ